MAKRAVIWVVVWVVATAGFLVVSFSGEGPAELAEDTPKRNLTAAGVFIGCIGLNDAFRPAGAVPVNWLWFLAFATMAVAHLSQAVTAVVLYAGVLRRAQG